MGALGWPARWISSWPAVYPASQLESQPAGWLGRGADYIGHSHPKQGVLMVIHPPDARMHLPGWISGEPAGEPARQPGREAGYISHSDPKQGVLMVIQLLGTHKCTQSFFLRRQLAS